MNSDPHESAAWRTFGMLDADEAAGFDAAMRHDPELRNAYREMECLSAAVAAIATVPVVPRAGQLERLHLRLGLNPSKRTNWLGISGWAAAAVLTAILLLDRDPARANPGREITRIQPTKSSVAPRVVPVPPLESSDAEEPNVANQTDSQATTSPVTTADLEVKAIVKVETKRLIQEIEVLRDRLEGFQERDRKRFEAVAGMAWPVVMRMRPPGAIAEIHDGLALRKEEPPITTMLGDALAGAMADPESLRTFDKIPAPTEPSAIPIYDPARDAGTIVINGDLPAKAAGESYQLWVMTEQGGSPIYVGTLPESNTQGADIFDFSLGSTTTVPSSFVLTKGAQGNPTAPSKNNTVLEGPR
jgi:hypothetical protein